jgi:uncharacterized protein YjbI with pentapeptide repeats
MVSVSHKKTRLDQEAAAGMTSLLHQGGAVLACFIAMLALTGGAPSGLAVGLTVGLSGIFVTWSEQYRLTREKRLSKQNKSFSISQNEKSPSNETLALPSSFTEGGIKKWLEQLEDEGISPNKLAILRRKLTDFPPEVNAMTKLEPIVIAITESKGDFFELATLAGLDPLCDFTGSNLKGAQLSPLFWSGANLSGANLSEADLSGTNLIGADLREARLIGVQLSGADLSGTNLIGADLREARLIGVKLSLADLSEAILDDANLYGANLLCASLIRASLICANLSRTSLLATNLSGANLSGADLSGANLSGANLSGANVENTQFSYNLGISLELKHDLQSRGAIFEDSPGDRGKVLSPH